MPGATPLPALLPVFPLTGTLLLPGNLLPLNIFEPRYRNLVADALAEGNHVGMIQPVVPRLDNFGALLDPTEVERAPELYHVGCAGRIERSEKQPDGRYEIVLRGICRFHLREELAEKRGYRQVAADYRGFERDLTEPQVVVDPGPMLSALRGFGAKHGLELDFDLLGALPGIALLNGLAVALPFRPEEKQALLEAGGPMEREQLLLTLMGMGLEPMSAEEYFAPPTVH